MTSITKLVKARMFYLTGCGNTLTLLLMIAFRFQTLISTVYDSKEIVEK